MCFRERQIIKVVQVSRSRKSILNLTWGMIYRITNMLFPFIIKSMIIYTLGKQYLGLNSLFTAILSMLSLSELGIGSALVYNMYQPIATGDTKKVCSLLNAYKRFYQFISLIIFTLGIILMPFIKLFINGSYPNDVNIYFLYFIYLINTVLSYTFFAYKTSILEACQDNSIESKLHFIINIFMYGFQIAALIFTHNYYIYLIIMPATTLVLNIIRSNYVDKKYPQYKCEGILSKKELETIFKNIRALVGHKIGTTVILSADSIVLSSFLGLDIVAMYSNYNMILNSLMGLVTILYTAVMASVGNSLVMEKKERVYRQFGELNFLNQWVVSWCTVCLFCLYQPFMTLWMGEDMLFAQSTVVLFCVYFYSRQIRRIGLTYKEAAGMWQEDFWKPYVGVIVNLIGNIVLVLLMGVDGIIISTIVVMVLVYFPWETYVLQEKLFARPMRNYLLNIGFNIIITIISCFITNLACSRIFFTGVKGLFFKGINCLIIPNLILLLVSFRKTEFKNLCKRVHLLVNKL